MSALSAGPPALPAAVAAGYILSDYLLRINDRYLVLIHTLAASLWVAVVLVESSDLLLTHTGPLCGASTLASERALLGYMVGFFVYDLILCIKKGSTVAWYMHGGFSLVVYVTGYSFGWAQGYASRFTAYEWSSIFYLASQKHFINKDNSPTLYHATRVLFAVTFFIVRFLYGLPLSFVFQKRTFTNYHLDKCVRVEIQFVIVIVNTLFALLNLYWGYMIIASILKKKDQSDGNEMGTENITCNGSKKSN